MLFANRAQVEHLRLRYPIGTRVELVEMDDAQAPPIGTQGTVTGVDVPVASWWTGIMVLDSM